MNECLGKGCRIADIGGLPGNWRYLRCDAQVVLVNLEFAPERDERFVCVIADGRRLPFRSDAFDVAYSNSVIEHVGGPGEQEAFAEEIKRIGKGYFVQTPNRWFVIEPHLLAPFIHFLPRSLQRRVARWFTIWGLVQRPSQQEIDRFLAGIHLLGVREMSHLFPGARLIRERILGFTKSFVAVRRPDELN
jgi:hypothetical protein